MDSSPQTSPTLMKKLLAPDNPEVREAAWKRFTELYTPILRDWARRFGVREADAADVAQEILHKLVTDLSLYQPQPGKKFGAWLWTVTKHMCRDFFRDRSTRPLPDADGLSGVNDEVLLGEFEEEEHKNYIHKLIRGALEQIRSDLVGNGEQTAWLAFEKLELKGQQISDVEATLGVSRSTIYRACRMVKDTLKKQLVDFLD